MKTLKHVIRIAVLGLSTAACLTAMAQTLTDGEVRKIDKENRKITLKHGEIKSLDMPPMTMAFQVSDPALLDKLKPGDKVQFNAVKNGGKLTVTEIKPVK
jgi:Cu/Ag efflux protein CusF